jgi:hypothetical protein
MIESPFRYEPNFAAKDYETLGKVMLRWSHIDHVIANCLKRLLRLSEDEGQVIVFQLDSKVRLDRIRKLQKIESVADRGGATCLC